MISPIAAKAQGFFHRSRSSLNYRLHFAAFTVVKIVWLVAQGASVSGSILEGRPGPVCEGGVQIFAYVGDKTQAFGIRRWYNFFWSSEGILGLSIVLALLSTSLL